MDPKYLREKNEEEIDIIELLQRVKEGKAPKKIEINGKVYIRTLCTYFLGVMYVEENNMSAYWELNNYTIDTIIKILDKPIIEELEIKGEMADKINEIIRYLNKEEK